MRFNESYGSWLAGTLLNSKPINQTGRTQKLSWCSAKSNKNEFPITHLCSSLSLSLSPHFPKGPIQGSPCETLTNHGPRGKPEGQIRWSNSAQVQSKGSHFQAALARSRLQALCLTGCLARTTGLPKGAPGGWVCVCAFC